MLKFTIKTIKFTTFNHSLLSLFSSCTLVHTHTCCLRNIKKSFFFLQHFIHLLLFIYTRVSRHLWRWWWWYAPCETFFNSQFFAKHKFLRFVRSRRFHKKTIIVQKAGRGTHSDRAFCKIMFSTTTRTMWFGLGLNNESEMRKLRPLNFQMVRCIATSVAAVVVNYNNTKITSTHTQRWLNCMM